MAIMSKSIFIGSAAAKMYFQTLATDNYASNKNKPFPIGMLQKNHPVLSFSGKDGAPAFALRTTCASDDVSDDKKLSILNRPRVTLQIYSPNTKGLRAVRSENWCACLMQLCGPLFYLHVHLEKETLTRWKVGKHQKMSLCAWLHVRFSRRSCVHIHDGRAQID